MDFCKLLRVCNQYSRMLLLRKDHLHLVKPFRTQLFPCSCFLKDLVFGFSTAANQQDQSQKPPLIVHYLINSCGFSMNEAIKASKGISHIKCASKPDAVVTFLKQNRFSGADIKRMISSDPYILCAKVDKSLEPNLKALQGIGFSEPQLVQFVRKNPSVLRIRTISLKLETLKAVFGSVDMLVRVCNYGSFVTISLQKRLLPNLLLLRECGITDQQIAIAIQMSPRLLASRIDVLKVHIERAKKYGVPCESGMFIYLLCALISNSKESLDAKFKLLKSFGLSDEDLLSVICKGPGILKFSKNEIRARMEFFSKEAACEPSFIASHPSLLTRSFTKTVIPRWRVLQTLKLKEVPCKRWNLANVMLLGRKRFLEIFVLPYLGLLPDLLQVYTAACGHNRPISS